MKLMILIPCIATLMTGNVLADGVESLAKVKSFAFGGVGYAGTISQGESLFRSVLAGHDALAQFRKILSKGTPEAKLYALCGIRALDRDSFASAAAALRAEDPKVETVAGCMISKQSAAGVIKNISSGVYDRYWSKK